MRQSRRNFLTYSAASLMVLAGVPATRWIQGDIIEQANAQPLTPQSREFILLCDTKVRISAYEKSHMIASKRPGSLQVLDVAANQTSIIDLPFFGHTTDQRPQHPTQVVSFEKWGLQGGLIDISDKKLLEAYQPYKDYQFYGHALFNADGSLLVDTEYRQEHEHGVLALRNLSDKKITETYSSYGALPHGCCTHDEGKTIIVTNSGSSESAPNVSWIDFASGKLLKQIELDKSYEVRYGHLAMSHDGWLCVCGSNMEKSKKDTFNLVVFIAPDGKVHVPEIPKDLKRRLQNEALSLEFLGQSGLVGITIPDSDLVLIFDYKTQKIIEAVDIAKPRGILQNLHDPHHPLAVMTNLAKDRTFASIEVDQAHQPPAIENLRNGLGGLGSHMTRVYV